MQVSFAINDKVIMLFGGWVKYDEPTEINLLGGTDSSKEKPKQKQIHTKRVYKYIVEHQQFLPERELNESLISIYPPFIWDGNVLLVHEDSNKCPKIITYDMSKI